MNLFHIAWRYLMTRRLVTLLSLISIVLGVALISAVNVFKHAVEEGFTSGSELSDLVVGAKGSPLQLVLSTLFLMDVPTGNIQLSEYEKLQEDERVSFVVPLGLGDNYKGYRIVGTNEDFFKITRHLDQEQNNPIFELDRGRIFSEPFEVVLGSEVARLANLKMGDTFVGAHGTVAVPGADHHSDFPYTVVGILKPSGYPFDRGIYTPMQSVWDVHADEEKKHMAFFLKDGQFQATEQKEKGVEITAMLVQLETPGMRLWMHREINDQSAAMAAIPVNEMLRLFNRVLEPLKQALLLISFIVVVVSVLGIVTTLYQSIERRTPEIKLMRTLGAYRWEVYSVVLLEIVILTLSGIIMGALLGHGSLAVAKLLIPEAASMSVSVWTFTSDELIQLGLVFLFGLAGGIIPVTIHYFKNKLK